MTEQNIPVRVPAGATPEGDGVVVGDGPAWVDAYIDFLCPYCRRFERAAGPTLAEAGRAAPGPRRLPPDELPGCGVHHGLLDPGRRGVRVRRRLRPVPRVTRMSCSPTSHPRAAPGLTDAELAALGDAAGLAWHRVRGLPGAGRRTGTGRPT